MADIRSLGGERLSPAAVEAAAQEQEAEAKLRTRLNNYRERMTVKEALSVRGEDAEDPIPVEDFTQPYRKTVSLEKGESQAPVFDEKSPHEIARVLIQEFIAGQDTPLTEEEQRAVNAVVQLKGSAKKIIEETSQRNTTGLRLRPKGFTPRVFEEEEALKQQRAELAEQALSQEKQAQLTKLGERFVQILKDPKVREEANALYEQSPIDTQTPIQFLERAEKIQGITGEQDPQITEAIEFFRVLEKNGATKETPTGARTGLEEIASLEAHRLAKGIKNPYAFKWGNRWINQALESRRDTTDSIRRERAANLEQVVRKHLHEKDPAKQTMRAVNEEE